MQPKTTAKDFFIYLAGFVALYTSAVSLISLLFAIVNKAFPDNLTSGYIGYDPYSSGMRIALASLIIIFPLYVAIASYLNKYLRANPEKKEISVRKWLTYLTLFITAVTVVIDLVVLVNTFLGGEISTRFVLKVVVVLVVAGAVFAYYLYDLRKSFAPDMPNRTKLIASIASAVVLAALVAGFSFLGSPTTARYIRFDQTRVQDLTEIQSQLVYNYWQQKGELPLTIDLLNNSISNFVVPVDPETGESYVYEKTGRVSFKLCADFRMTSQEINEKSEMSYPAGELNNNWKHGVGTTCFDRTIDEKLYPVNKDQIPTPIQKY